MPPFLHYRRLAAGLLLAATLLASTVYTPATASALTPGPIRLSPQLTSNTLMGAEAVTGTTNLAETQVVTATSGLTVVRLMRHVSSGGYLGLQVQTLPGAHLVLRIDYPDGTYLAVRRQAGITGTGGFNLPVNYQPQGSSEAALVTVRAYLFATGLNDTVHASVDVLQHIVLKADLKLPKTVTVGHTLTIEVVSNQPDALVRFRLTYPDRQVESQRGFTDPSGKLTKRFAVSKFDGTKGFLTVQVWLNYGGVQIQKSGRVALRAAKS